MTPIAYAHWVDSLGTYRQAARALGCAPATVRMRMEGATPITPAAALLVREAVHAAALEADATWAERRARRKDRRQERRGMTAGEFRAALHALGWDRAHAARWLLGPEPADVGRVGRWATGAAAVPPWCAAHLRRALELEPGDPWPTGAHAHAARVEGGGGAGKRGGGSLG